MFSFNYIDYSCNGPLYLPNLLYYELKVLDNKIKMKYYNNKHVK